MNLKSFCSRLFAFLLVTASLLAAAPAMAQGLNARDFGAKGDGQADDTAAIQKALDKASANGSVVSLPPGQYRLNGRLTIPVGVSLVGSWQGPHTSHLDKGSVLLCYAGRDDEKSSPTISLFTSSTIKGVTIFYPEQKVEEIHPYPWTIQGRGQHYNVLDVTIVNAYNGVDCGTYHNEGHHLRNVHLCAVNKGVYIDMTTDIGRTENVHIHNVYWWRVSEPHKLSEAQIKTLENYTTAHLTGFIIGRTDWEYMSNCFVIWAKVGFHFIQNPQHGMANAVITQCGADIGPLAVKIDGVQDHAGIAFENCQFMSGFEIAETNKGHVKLTNCGFWGDAGAESQMVLRGKGAVILNATHFWIWDPKNTGKPCIQALNGSLQVNGCEFAGQRKGMNHILLGKDLKAATIVGNVFRKGTMNIKNESKGDVQIGLNAKY